MAVYKIRKDPDRFSDLLRHLNKRTRDEKGMRARLHECAEQLLQAKPKYKKLEYRERVAFHITLRRLMHPVLDVAKIKVQPFRRTWGTGVHSATISTTEPLLIFEPRSAEYFWEFLHLASDFDAVAHFTKCEWCKRFFMAKKKGTKFCRVKHAAAFHNRQPDRQSKVREAVARHRRKKMRDAREPELRQYVRKKDPTKYDWQSVMGWWNEGHSRKPTWKFKNVDEFKREVKKKQPQKPPA